MTRNDRAREVIEALDPLAVGEEVWFVWNELNGSQTRMRGVVKFLFGNGDKAIAHVTLTPALGPIYQVCIDDITRDK